MYTAVYTQGDICASYLLHLVSIKKYTYTQFELNITKINIYKKYKYKKKHLNVEKVSLQNSLSIQFCFYEEVNTKKKEILWHISIAIVCKYLQFNLCNFTIVNLNKSRKLWHIEPCELLLSHWIKSSEF